MFRLAGEIVGQTLFQIEELFQQSIAVTAYFSFRFDHRFGNGYLRGRFPNTRINRLQILPFTEFAIVD